MSEDLISKEKAYEVLTEYYHHRTEMQHKALREALDMVPSADIDLSDYSDRLWRKAYEQGKADAEAEPKKGQWIPGKELSREMLAGQVVNIEYENYRCSACGIPIDRLLYHVDGSPFYKFCPNCGADMRGEEK